MTVIREATRTTGFRRLLKSVKDVVPVERLADDLGAKLGSERASGERRGYGVCHGGDNLTALSVDVAGQRWFCHRCSEGGDVLNLWERIHGYTDSKLALMDLAAEYGVEPPGRPQRWHEWDSEKARRRRMIRTKLARAYQRRYFRLFGGYLASIQDAAEREKEAKRFWSDLWPLAVSCAELRLKQ